MRRRYVRRDEGLHLAELGRSNAAPVHNLGGLGVAGSGRRRPLRVRGLGGDGVEDASGINERGAGVHRHGDAQGLGDFFPGGSRL